MHTPIWLLLLLAASACAGDRLGGSVVLTSDYRLRGVSQSDNSPAVQMGLHYDAPSGVLAGVWGSSVQSYSRDGSTAQLSAFMGYRWPLGGDWTAKVVAAHYVHPWDALSGRYDYDELEFAAAYRDRAFVTVAYSPNLTLASPHSYVRNRSALSYDAAVRLPVRGRLSSFAGIGYYDLSELAGTGYWYGSAGFVFALQRLHLELSWVQTRGARRLFYGDVAAAGWSGTLIWSF